MNFLKGFVLKNFLVLIFLAFHFQFSQGKFLSKCNCAAGLREHLFNLTTHYYSTLKSNALSLKKDIGSVGNACNAITAKNKNDLLVKKSKQIFFNYFLSVGRLRSHMKIF